MKQVNRRGEVRCRVCRCTQTEPCNPACSWAETDLCTGCAFAIMTLGEWLESSVFPNRSRLWMEALDKAKQGRVKARLRNLRRMEARP